MNTKNSTFIKSILDRQDSIVTALHSVTCALENLQHRENEKDTSKNKNNQAHAKDDIDDEDGDISYSNNTYHPSNANTRRIPTSVNVLTNDKFTSSSFPYPFLSTEVDIDKFQEKWEYNPTEVKLWYNKAIFSLASKNYYLLLLNPDHLSVNFEAPNDIVNNTLASVLQRKFSTSMLILFNASGIISGTDMLQYVYDTFSILSSSRNAYSASLSNFQNLKWNHGKESYVIFRNCFTTSYSATKIKVTIPQTGETIYQPLDF